MSGPGGPAAPDFLCIGAQKAGTRWLFDQLDHHPDFWMPPVKELHYFDGPRGGRQRAGQFRRKAIKNLDALNRRRVKNKLPPFDQRSIDFLAAYLELPWPNIDIERYGRLFELKGPLLSGDITPDYSVLKPRVIRRIARAFPRVKVVFLARDPVERAWSNICQAVRHREGGAVNEETISKYVRSKSVARRSASSAIVSSWRQVIPPERFGLFFFDELRTDPAGLRGRIIAFLGGDPAKPSGVLPPNFNRKQNVKKIPIAEDIRTRLIEACTGELRAGAEEFGGLALEWRKKYGV